MRVTSRTTFGELLTGLGALVAAVLVQGVIVWTTLDRLQSLDADDDEARAESLHYGVMIEAVQDQDAGLRGFLASRDPAFLRTYEDARGRFVAGVPEMVALAADDPKAMRDRVADIVRRHQRWVKTVAEPRIGVARTGIALGDATYGRADIDAIRADFAMVRGEETRLLDERDGMWDVAFRTSRLTLLFGSLAALSFAILIAARSLMRLTQQRQAAQAAATMLSDALERAHAAERAKTLFLSNMSHEMRTPLNGVAGMAEALGRTALDPSQSELVGVIRESAAALDGLIGDLLTLSRGEQPEEAVRNAAPFSLGAAVRALTEEHRGAAQLKGLRLEAAIASDCELEVAGDTARLAQLLSCLLSNAVKFTDRGSIRLTLDAVAEGQYRFAVADTGVGFDEARKTELFETFSQSDDSATRRYGGAGLGLALVRQLAGDLGGHLDCRSEPGRGSVFIFEVAMAPAAAAAEPAPADEDETPLRILVVDDNATNRKVLELILEQLGVESVSVEDGQQAVDAVAREAFAAILMDIQMPVMDGLTATREIRRREQAAGRAAIPVIIVSANGQPEHVQAGRAAGAQLHLTKPVNATDLAGALNAVLGEPAGDDAAIAA